MTTHITVGRASGFRKEFSGASKTWTFLSQAYRGEAVSFRRGMPRPAERPRVCRREGWIAQRLFTAGPEKRSRVTVRMPLSSARTSDLHDYLAPLIPPPPRVAVAASRATIVTR